jgi:hypothetical protein
MNSKQIRIVYGAAILALLLSIISLLLFAAREKALPLSSAPLAFDASEAYRITRDFVTQFPNRIFGSLESRQSTGYIHDYLRKLGYPIVYAHFDGRIAGHIDVGRNIFAFKKGKSPEILALIAHLDTARTTGQGAMDNGSGVGVLLELARILSSVPMHRSLLLVFSDGEEWGMLGARDVAATYPERNRIAAVLSLDHVGIGDLEAFCLEETGQLKGFTPAWLRHLARRAAESQGLPVRSPGGFSEYLERAVLISQADQGPFLAAGIPAINLGSESRERSLEKEVYHSERDTIENLKPVSFGIYGRAAERLVRTLDDLPSIPLQSPNSLRLWDSLFVRSGAMWVFQIIVFLPPVLILFFHLSNRCHQLRQAGVGREFSAFLATALPFWIIYFLIQLARVLRLLPVYTLYPATLKDPVLQTPAWGVLAGIFGTALFAAVVSFIIAKFSFSDLPAPDFHVSKSVLLTLLLIGIVLSFFHNPYWASLFFVLPAWIWAFAGHKKTSGARMLSRILILAAGVVYYAVLWIYASRMDMGRSFVWYQVLALSNGLFSKSGYFLATGIVAIGIRFLAIQSHDLRQ